MVFPSLTAFAGAHGAGWRIEGLERVLGKFQAHFSPLGMREQMTKHLAGGPQNPLLNPAEDYGTEWDAATLAARIRAYWARRGRFPNVWVERLLTVQSPSAGERFNYIVQSDMVGGKPI